MEEFIAHATIIGGLYKIVDLPCAGLPNHGQELQRGDYLFAIVLAPVLLFQTARIPHCRCSGPTISSLSKDERKAATR